MTEWEIAYEAGPTTPEWQDRFGGAAAGACFYVSAEYLKVLVTTLTDPWTGHRLAPFISDLRESR